MARVSDSDGDVGAEFTEGDFTYVITSESEASDTSGTVRIKSYTDSTGSISELTIPSTATDPSTERSYNVTSIGSSAFKSKPIVSVTIPATVTSIENYAFGDCASLEKIEIPNSVASIGRYAFTNCALTSICFGTGITSVDALAFGSSSKWGVSSPTVFSKSDGTCLDLSELDGFRGWTFTGDMKKMVREASYALTFNPDNGSSLRTEDHHEGDKIEKPEDPQKTGYTFRYWGAEGGGEFDFETGTMPAKDMTLTAVWKVNQYTIKFDSDGGSPVNSITQDYGTQVDKPADPTKDGCRFVCWEKDGKEYAFDTMPAENILLKAVWESDAVTVTFVTGAGTEIAEEHRRGEAITLPGEGGEISKTGYSLSGWQISGEGDVYGPGTEYTVMSDVMFTAVWKVNQYTISFDPDGGSPVDPITQDYGTLVEKPADPTRNGYTFVCWMKDGEEYAFGTMPAEDIVLKAVWESLPVPAWDDDDDPYVPVPDSDAGSKNSDAAGSGTSVAAVAIAAGCAAALLVMLAMLGNGRSRN